MKAFDVLSPQRSPIIDLFIAAMATGFFMIDSRVQFSLVPMVGDAFWAFGTANKGQAWQQVAIKLVDKLDQLMAYYSFLHKSVKWWRKIFWLLEVMVINSYIIYRELAKARGEKPLTQLTFRRRLIESLSRSAVVPPPVPGLVQGLHTILSASSPYVTSLRKEERDETVWSAVTDKVA